MVRMDKCYSTSCRGPEPFNKVLKNCRGFTLLNKKSLPTFLSAVLNYCKVIVQAIDRAVEWTLKVDMEVFNNLFGSCRSLGRERSLLPFTQLLHRLSSLWSYIYSSYKIVLHELTEVCHFKMGKTAVL